MDTHGMKFVVDTTGVAKGFRDYKSAVDGIFTSLAKFEAHVDKTMKGVSKASANPQALSAFKKAVSAFSKVDIDTSAARKLSALSAAMNGFKAPSASQAANTKKFFNALSGLPDLSAAYRSVKALDSLKSAMNGFKAPAASQAKNLAAFASALNSAAPAFARLKSMTGISGIANELASISIAMRNIKVPSASQVTNLGNLGMALRSLGGTSLGNTGPLLSALGTISNFKAPSAAQVRNLQSFINAVSTLRVPPNGAAISDMLHRLSIAAAAAGNNLGRLRGNLGSLGGSLGHVGGQARGASIQMMGLQNAFSATFQAGSLLRSLLGSLTIAELGRNFFEATNSALQFRAQMTVLNKDVGFAGEQLDYVNKTASRFGVDMLAAEQGFAKISIAADKSGMSVMQTRHIFEGMTTAMSVLGITTAGQQDVWLALQQVMNKGYLSAEELNQQLNEKLPGAMAYATEYAESLGTTLEKGLKTKALDAAGVLEHISRRMKEDFGPAVEGALMRPAAQMNILRNNFNLLFQAIGEAGGNEAFATLLKSLNEKMRPEDIERMAQAIGVGLKNAVDKLAGAFNWLYENWDSIKGPLATTLELMGKWMLISGSLQIARFIVQPLLQIGPALAGLRTFGAMLTVLAASSLPAAIAGVTALGAANSRAVLTMLALRNSIAATIAGMRAGTLATVGFATSLRALGASAAAAAVGGLRSLVTLLGGPYLLTLAAAGYAAYQMYDIYQRGQTVIAESQSFLESNRKTVEQATASIGLNTISLQYNGWQHSFLGVAINTATSFMDAYRAKLDEATNGLWSMAEAARAATIETLKLQQSRVQSHLSSLQVRSTSELGNLAGQQWDRGEYGRAASTTVYRGAVGLGSATGFGPSQSDVTSEIGKTRRELAGINARITAAENMSNEDIRKHLKGRGYGTTPRASTGPRTEGAGGKGRKGPKGKTYEQQANEAENAVDQLMKKLYDRDPVGKIQNDFVKNLTDEAHVLLNDKGYKMFFEGMKASAGDATKQTQALIDALQSGNISAKTMEDLKARYGEDVSGIIDMLKAQQANYEQALKEATVKALDVRYKAFDAAMDSLSEGIPIIAEVTGNMDRLVKLGMMVMPPGEGFNKWVADVRSGAITAEDALAQLEATMRDPAKRSATVGQIQSMTGVTPEEIIAAEKRRLRAAAETRRQAELDLKFGERILTQRNDEIILLGVSAKRAEVLTTVQEEVNRAKAVGKKITTESIAVLTKEVEAQQALADQMQRNREFFENNGVRGYLNELKSVGETVNELDKNVLQSLEDQLFSLGTTGTFSFKAIFDTLQQGLVRFASQGLMKTLTEKLFNADERNGGTPSLFGGLFKLFGAKYEPAQVGKLGTEQNPMYVAWASPASVGILGNIMRGKGQTEVGVGDPEGLQSAIQDPLTSAIDSVGNIIKTEWSADARSVGGILTSMLSSMQGGGGGAGGLLGGLLNIGMSLLGGGGNPLSALVPSANATIAANPGIFKEGGYSGSPVSRGSLHPAAFTNAPHYAEGTPNTSGGMPAILHDNEAVIPLTRGRKVAVEMAGGNRGQVINNNFHVSTPDANSFRKSKQQIATDMHMQAGRAFRRNHG